MNRRWLHPLLIALAVAAIYWPSLTAGFMYDDRFFVQENAHIREWSSAPSFFTAPAASQASVRWEGIWRPLRSLSFLVDYRLWGLNPSGFHLTNAVLHCGNALLCYLFMILLFGDAAAALAAALLFALHPAQTEAVTWISSRGDLLFALFSLSSLILYRLGRTGRRPLLLIASFASFALALLSKEAAIVLPALIMLTDWMAAREELSPRRHWPAYLVFWLMSVLYFVLRRGVLGAAGQCPYWGESFPTTMLTMVRVAADYVRLLAWPWPLHVDYVYQLSRSPADWRVLLCLLFLSGLTALAVRDARRSRAFAWAWGWFAIALLPVSNLIPITTLLAERFLYFPLVGIAAWAGLQWSARRRSRFAYPLLIAVLLAFAGLSFVRNMEWREPFAFWRAEAARSPDSFIAHGYLGNIYYLKGDLASAEAEFDHAIAIEPKYTHSLLGQALVYVRTGRYQCAIDYAQRCLAVDTAFIDAYITMGISYISLGDPQSAETAFRKAARMDPGNKQAWTNLGVLFIHQQRWSDATTAFDRAIRADPGDYTLYNDLAGAHAHNGELATAVGLLRSALAINADYMDARMNLAQALEGSDPRAAAGEWRRLLDSAQRLGQPVNGDFIRRRIARLEGHGHK